MQVPSTEARQQRLLLPLLALLILACIQPNTRLASAQVITTVAGTPRVSGFSGDGGLAAEARLNGPVALALDAAGALFICDVSNYRVRRVGTDGFITTVAGNGSYGYSGDGGLATEAMLSVPRGVAVDLYSGHVYVADSNNQIIRRFLVAGNITTVAGQPGVAGFTRDNGPRRCRR